MKFLQQAILAGELHLEWDERETVDQVAGVLG